MSSLVHRNEQRSNEVTFVFFLTSYLHRLADTTFYEFIPCDLHKMLQDVTFSQVYTLEKISGFISMNFGQHYPAFGQHDFGRDDFRATWPVTGIAWRSSPARALFFSVGGLIIRPESVSICVRRKFHYLSPSHWKKCSRDSLSYCSEYFD